MCTVSFVHVDGKTIITSNRDEKIIRPTAVAPKNYKINQKRVIFPKDSKAGGTWYAVDEYANVIVLLNGAEEKHVSKGGYIRSRGLIVLDLIGANSPLEAWFDINLNHIEPFTIVLYENQRLYQLRWNELKKNTLELDTTQSYIWSSSTLYSREIRQKRASWFYTFLDTKPEVNETELFHFHRYTEAQNTEHGLIINRDEILKTLSITQTVVEQNKVTVKYSDLITKDEFATVFISV